MIAIFRKIQDYCLRFCLIIHVMREAAEEIPWSKSIDEDTALRATILAEYFFLTAKETYNLVQQGGFNYRSKLAVGWHRLLLYCEGKVHIEGKIVSILLMN